MGFSLAASEWGSRFLCAFTLSFFLVRARSESLPLSLTVHTLRSSFHTLSFGLSLTETLSLLPSHALSLVSLSRCLSFYSESFSTQSLQPPFSLSLPRSVTSLALFVRSAHRIKSSMSQNTGLGDRDVNTVRGVG